ncbi:hypothetical protein EB008_01365 [bacterium]|jgi:hypothetical protein|nr:hypothetical protein [bacterium]
MILPINYLEFFPQVFLKRKKQTKILFSIFWNKLGVIGTFSHVFPLSQVIDAELFKKFLQRF